MDNIFDEVAAKLSSAGMDEASVTASKKALQDAFSGLTEEELKQKLESEGGTDGITESILKKYEEAKKKKAEGGPDVLSLDDNMFSDEAVSAADQKNNPENKEGSINELLDADSKNTDDDGVDSVITEIDGNESGSSSSRADEYFNDDDDVKVKQPERRKKTAKKPAEQPSKSNTPKKKNVSIKNMSTRAKTIYIVGLVVLIPLVIALVMAITLLFLALYAAIIFLVVAFSVALVLVAAVGTAVSLMAIIFGIIQLVKGVAAPIGIYEIGIGIAAGGVTLGVSILLYNFIVRLAPFLFKKMFVLYKFLFRQLTKLMSFLKGVCGKL